MPVETLTSEIAASVDSPPLKGLAVWSDPGNAADGNASTYASLAIGTKGAPQAIGSAWLNTSARSWVRGEDEAPDDTIVESIEVDVVVESLNATSKGWTNAQLIIAIQDVGVSEIATETLVAQLPAPPIEQQTITFESAAVAGLIDVGTLLGHGFNARVSVQSATTFDDGGAATLAIRKINVRATTGKFGESGNVGVSKGMSKGKARGYSIAKPRPITRPVILAPDKTLVVISDYLLDEMLNGDGA